MILISFIALLLNSLHFSFQEVSEPEIRFEFLYSSLKGKHSFTVYENKTFQSKDLEYVYKCVCLNLDTKRSRQFYIQKTDANLKVITLAEFILVEEKKGKANLIYPFGWEFKNIAKKDLPMNCKLIIEQKVPPL